MLHSNAAGNSLPIEFKSPNGQSIHVQLHNGEPVFLGADLIRSIGLGNISRALEKLPEDEKLTLQIVKSGQSRQMWFVTEPGMYRLIFRSYKPEAEKFQRWVFHDVLPQIRKTGSYTSSRKKYIETDEEKTLFILIAMHLRVGDIKDIAKSNNWSRHRVSRVKRGITVDVDILKALAARAAHNMHNPLRKYGAVAANQLDLFTTHTQLS